MATARRSAKPGGSAKPKLPRAPLPAKTGGPHKDRRRPARVNARTATRAATRLRLDEE